MRSEWGISYIIISYLIAFVCLVFGGLCLNLPTKVCWQWPTLIGSPFCALDVRRLTLIFYISDGQHWDVHKDVQYVSEHSFTMHLIVSNIFIAHLKKINTNQPWQGHLTCTFSPSEPFRMEGRYRCACQTQDGHQPLQQRQDPFRSYDGRVRWWHVEVLDII